MVTCTNHPNRSATYDSPEDWCDECWMNWWLEGYEEFLDEGDLEEEKKKIEEIQHEHSDNEDGGCY